MRARIATALLMVLPASALGASGLTVAHARRAIQPEFRQELAYANPDSVSAHLGPCRKNGARIVTCRSRATLANGVHCTKLYRAKLSDGDITVLESATGRTFTRSAHSRCS